MKASDLFVKRLEAEGIFQAEGLSLVVVPIDYRENDLLSKRLGQIACTI